MKNTSSTLSFQQSTTKIATLLIRSPVYAFHPTINELLRLISLSINAQRVYLMLADESAKMFYLSNEWVAHPDLRSNIFIDKYPIRPEDYPVWGRIIQSGRSFIINSLKELPDEATNELKELKRDRIKSIIGIPLFEGKKMVGYLGLDYITEQHQWQAKEVTWLEQTANMLAPYIFRAQQAEKRLYEEDFKRKSNIQHVISETDSGKKSINDLEILWEASVHLHKLHTKEQVFAYASATLYRILGKSIVVVTEHLENEGVLITRNITGVNETVEKAIKIANYKTIGHKQPLNPDYLTLLLREKAMLHTINDGIYEASMGLLNKQVSTVIEKMLGIKSMYGLGMHANNTLYGTALLILRSKKVINKEVLESFSHMVSMSLERIFAQQELLKSKRDQRDILEFMSEAVLRTDLTGKIVYANNAASKISGYTHEELLEKNLVDFAYSSSDIETVKAMVFNNFSEKNQTFVTEIKSKSGNKKIIEVKGSQIIGANGSTKGFLGVISDITNIRKKEAALIDMEIERKSREFKHLFLSNMSHEMLTPINGIVGIANILLQSEMDKNSEEMLQIIKDSTEELLKTIASIWDTMSLNEGGKHVALKNFNLCSLLHHNHSLFRASILEKNIALNFTCHHPSNSIIQADEFKINQILSNLLGNAIKFNETNGSIEMEITLTSQEDDRGTLRFDIKDTGPGVPEDKEQILFDYFQQADNSHTRVHQGLGLGLYISKQLVTIIGGKIGYTRNEKKGSNFWFEVPVGITVKAEKQSKCPCKLSTEYEYMALALVNNVTIKKVLEIIFKQNNIFADFAFSTPELKEFIAEKQYDILFVSPETADLIESINALKNLKKKKSTPIIALAAQTTCNHYLANSMDIFDDFIDNPFIAANLKEQLYKWTKKTTP